jgi:hypothetical protein
MRRVGAPGCPGAPLTEPDLWASHPALRDDGVWRRPLLLGCLMAPDEVGRCLVHRRFSPHRSRRDLRRRKAASESGRAELVERQEPPSFEPLVADPCVHGAEARPAPSFHWFFLRGHDHGGRGARLRPFGCLVRQFRCSCPRDVRGRLPSSCRHDWDRVSPALWYYATIRLLSSHHRLVLSSSVATGSRRRPRDLPG